MKVSITMADTFGDFIMSRKAKGLSDKTITTYKQQFAAIGKHLDTAIPIDELTKQDLEEMISSMRDAGLAPNSIKSYTRTLKSFFSWCNEEGITRLNIPLYKAAETVKETYSDAELAVLLQKPNVRKCTFAEYRSWVIVNLLLNNGCRAATIRNILIRDVDLPNRVIYLRHTKNKKAQVIPLCDALCAVLREYMRIRGGGDDDFLFPNLDFSFRQERKMFRISTLGPKNQKEQCSFWFFLSNERFEPFHANVRWTLALRNLFCMQSPIPLFTTEKIC